jgi:putative ABC transport system substrate-binding protein
MGPLRRAASLFAVGLVTASLLALPACSEDEPTTYKIALLRAVAGVAAESKLLDGLDEGGIGSAQVEIIGGEDLDEAYATEDEARAAVRRWVDRGVDAIVALSTTGAQIADEAAGDVPVLFLSSDPRATGLVRNERRPEGHLTGMSYRVPGDRTLALISDAFPSVGTVGCLYPPSDPAAVPAHENLEQAASDLDLTLVCETFSGPDDADDAAQALLNRTVDAVVIVNSPTSVRATATIAATVQSAGLPIVTNTPNEAAELVLAPDAASIYEDLGGQLARVLRGAPIADVPVQDPGRFLVIVNEIIARRNGHVIPANVLEGATQVIR